MLSLRDDDHDEGDTGYREAQSARGDVYEPKDRLVPEPSNPVRNLAPQIPRRRTTLFLEFRSHEEEGDDGGGIRERIREEGDCLAELEEEAAERGANDTRCRTHRLLGCRGRRNLLRWDDVGQIRRLGGTEEDVEDTTDHRIDVQLRHGEVPEPQGERNGAHVEGPAGVTEDHHPLAVPAIRECSGG